MTMPRQVLPGTTYLITRRCAQRQFLLRPSDETNAIFLYVLAVAAQRFGILVHAFCVLSNHFHLVLTDPDARLPAFEQYLDALVARAVNALLGRCESFWAPASYSAVALLAPEDIVEKVAYTLANPVAAGLVRRGRDWPGLWSAPEQLGTTLADIPRPRSFFRRAGPMPERAALVLTTPPGFASAEDFRRQVVASLARHEGAAMLAMAESGHDVLGPRAALAQSPTSSPSSPEPRRTLRPLFASRDGQRRIQALERLAAFLTRYRRARAAYRRGERDVAFPAGTYWMRLMFQVRCVTEGLAPSCAPG